MLALVLLILSGLPGPPIRLAAEFPATPAGAELKAAVRTINGGDRDSVRAFITENHSVRSLEFFGEETLFDMYYGVFERYEALELDRITVSSAEKAVGEFRCRLTGTGYRFGVTVEPQAPHRIRGLTILPLLDPGETGPVEPGRLGVVLQRLTEAGVFSGVVLVARGHDVLFRAGYGWADRESQTPLAYDAKLNLASLDKMFTAVAIAQLAESNKLSYDDPIGRYLGPDWIPPDVGRKVRIEHLLSHTSGIGGGDSNVTYVNECIRRGFRRVDDARVLTTDVTLKFEPGERHDYSNLGYHLLGAIIESVSGEDYYGYLRSHVFEPAGMTGTGFDEAANVAHGYVKTVEDGKVGFRNNRNEVPPKGTPAGCGYGTAEDLFRFAEAMQGDILVTPETREILFRPKVDLNSPDYGFGFQIRQIGDHRVVSHTGGWTGINNLFLMRDDGLVVVILSNVDILTGTVCEDLAILIPQMADGGDL